MSHLVLMLFMVAIMVIVTVSWESKVSISYEGINVNSNPSELISEATRSDESVKGHRFLSQMIEEMKNNDRKGSILDWRDYNEMISELEYHKAKMMIAIKFDEMAAAREYIADCANILMAIGNTFGLYDEYFTQEGVAHELKGRKFASAVRIKNQSPKTKLKDKLCKN